MIQTRPTKVLLIAPPWGDIYGSFKHVAKVGVFYPPLGLCYLASYLRDDGCEVRLMDAEAEGRNLHGVLDEVRRFQPDVIGIQVVSPLWDVVFEVCKAIKAERDVPIVLGGPHITIVGTEAFDQNPYFDYGVIGEGEETMRELVQRLRAGQPTEDVLGIVYRRDGHGIRNGERPAPKDLDSYLFPDRTGLLNERYLFSVPGKHGGIRRFATITSTRGCPFECTFCTEPMIFGRMTRFRSAENVVDEIEDAYRNHGVTHFIFVDDTLTVEKKRIFAVCDEIERRGLKVTFEGWTHANTITDELLQRMQRAGLRRLSFGVEAGNAAILKSLKKGTDHKRILAAFKAAKKAGIETRGSVILGLPGETVATVEESIRFTTSLKELDHCYFNIAMPYPGTEIRELALKGEKGTRLLSQEYSQLRRQGQSVVMEVNDLTTAELLRLQRKAYLKFWLTPRRIWYNIWRAGLKAGFINGWAFFKSFILPARRQKKMTFLSEITRLDDHVDGGAVITREGAAARTQSDTVGV
jgi:radical SAM superfamily enzyme YgiQ (UPF0313 family)